MAMWNGIKQVHVQPIAKVFGNENRHFGDGKLPVPTTRFILDRDRKAYGRLNLDRDLPFSWLRCFISVAGYLLLVSDVMRAGLGVRQEPASFQRLEPNELVFMGPVGYLTNHVTRANATANITSRLWPYKFDTTSISMRAFAEHFALRTWPPCVLYREQCEDSQRIGLNAVFAMVDSLVEAVANRGSAQTALSLRVGALFRDRLQHYVLPWFFEQTMKKSIQAVHFDVHPQLAICRKPTLSRPYSCASNWTRYLKGSCLTSEGCSNKLRVWREIPNHIRWLAKVYPNHAIDFVVLDGSEDSSRGGLSFQGRRRGEVVVLTRIRICDGARCKTVAIDDYRFEAATIVMNASAWYPLVASLRLVAQCYTWLRMVILIIVCHYARNNTSDPYFRTSFLGRLRLLTRTIFLIPSQVVVYGSMFPITLYFLAHAIDSPATYSLVSIRFNSLFGSFAWHASDFFTHTAVSMRSVWVLGICSHFFQRVLLESSWSPVRGILGFPELLFSSLAMVTIFAEFRALVLRDTRILDFYEIIPSSRYHQVRSYSLNTSQGAISNLLFGSTVDYKCLVLASLALLLISMLMNLLNRALPRHMPVQVALISRSLVPYSAGWLWPPNRLVVSWFGSLLSKVPPQCDSRVSFRRRSRMQRFQGVAFPSYGKTRRQLPQFIRSLPDLGLVAHNNEVTRQVWREMENIHRRSRQIEATIYLINLAVMTDPITALRLRRYSSFKVGLYMSTLTKRCFLLPQELQVSLGDVAIDWGELQLVAVMNTCDLEWDDLLRFQDTAATSRSDRNSDDIRLIERFVGNGSSRDQQYPNLQPPATNTSIFMSESSFFVQNDGSMKSAIVEITQLRFQSRGRTSLHKLLQRYRQSHSRSTLDHGQPFSWLSCLISMVSYTLLLSDVLRTGLGVRRLPRGTWKLEPDAAIFIGPSSYTTIHLTLKNASGASGIRYWPYKYDTTSIAMRSLAQLFNLPTWKPCLLYHATCDETHGLPFRAVFSMIDSLVHAVSTHSTEVKFRTSRRQMARGHITIRTENVFKDRLHHYALPWFFGCTIKRTNQAIYYQFESHQPISVALCESIQSPRPLSCQENWTRKTPDSCSGLRNVCTGSDDAWTALKNRLYFLASVYRNSSIDFVIIDGTEDFTRGGLTFQGQSFDEVVLLSRIRQCSDKQCATIAIDDSRYESAQFVMNASGWLNVVGSLRVVGQVYTWLRVVLLIRVHHLARQGTSEKYRKASLLHKAFVNIRTLFLIPSQIVIYGSLLPISLYLLAHLIDSPATYELVAIRFNSLFGQVTWTFADFLNHCAVSMRSVWLLSFLCHGVLAATTKRLWSLSNGIPGVPELFISFLASLTIWAQFRVIAWRDTRVLQVHEVVPSTRMYRVRDYRQYAARAPLSALLFGSTIDMQCVESAVLGALIVRLLLSILRRLIPKRFPFEVTLVSRTLVPYSAGSLWPRNRLVVNWFGSLITRTPAVSPTKTSFRRRSVLPAGSSAVAEYDSSRRLPSFIRAMPDRGLVVRDTEATRVVWQEMQSIDQRSVEVESTIYLMNLAVMTDPISVLRLRFFSGCSVGLYVSKYSRRWHLLPYGLKSSTGDIAIDWNQLELLAVINTKHLEWDDLLRCG